MESRVNSVPHVINPEENIKVARINYMYDNMSLIRTLDERGNLITSGTVEASPCCSDKKTDPISDINDDIHT
jgi:TPP-dependent pyruvate/acetoin dehydrogenase alpha subunit